MRAQIEAMHFCPVSMPLLLFKGIHTGRNAHALKEGHGHNQGSTPEEHPHINTRGGPNARHLDCLTPV